MTRIKLDLLVPNPHQPRQYFGEEEMEQLQDSLDAASQLDPIWVVPGDAPDIPRDIDIAPDQMLVIDGERRLKALLSSGAEEADVQVLNTPYAEAYHLAVVKQATAQSWSPIEAARAAVTTLLNRFEKEDWFKENFGEGPKAVNSCAKHIMNLRDGRTQRRKLTPEQEQLFEQYCLAAGGKLTQVKQWVERVNIPQGLADMVAMGAMEVSFAQALAPHADEGERSAMAQRLIRAPMSVDEAKKMVRLVGDKTVPESVKESLLEGETLPSALQGLKETGDLDALGKAFEEAKKIAEKRDITVEEAFAVLGRESKEFRELQRRIVRGPRLSRHKVKKATPIDRLVELVAERAIEADRYQEMDEYQKMGEADGLVQVAGPIIRRMVERTIVNRGERVVEALWPDPNKLLEDIERDMAMRGVG